MEHKMLSGESADPPMDQNPPKESRPPINLRIKFRSETVEQFIERYAVDVSRGGIFIRTKEPLAVGTQLKLDFQFQNGGALMSGDGTVVWIREFDPNRSSVPPGMGVRFDKLTPESQAVLEQLLGEKSKRERGGVPGSGVGGMAVRRPSSMFSVLEPQVSVTESPADEKSAPAATEGAGASATPGSKPSPGLAPLVGSPVGSAGVGHPRTPAEPHPATRAFGGTTGPRPSQRTTPSDDDAPFDVHDEPTQIAGKLPSLLSAEREGSSPAAWSPFGKAAGQKSAGGDHGARSTLGESTQAAASQSGHADALGNINVASKVAGEPEHKTDTLHTAGSGSESAHPQLTREQLLPIGNVSPRGSARDTVRDHVADPGAGAEARASDDAVAAPDQPPERAASSVVAEPASSMPAAAAASPPATATAALKAKPAKQGRSPAALVGVSVIVLGGAAIFLFRFFGSQATEVASPPPAAGRTISAAEPAAPPAPPPAPSAPAPTAAAAPAGGETTGTPPAGGAADNTAKPSSPSPSPSAATAPIPEVKPDDPTVASVRKAAKHRAPRGAKDPGETTSGAAITQAENKPPGAKPSEGRPTESKPAEGVAAPPVAPAAAKVDGQAAAPSDTEATTHEIRVTSKPVGADVALDGQTVGKTPYSVGIADVTAPHFIAVRKEGFEPFEQMISASSAWSKTKGAKGKPAVLVLKISAKLKQVAGSESRSATVPPAAGSEAPAKIEAPRTDRPLPPSDERAPPGTTP
jgi:uncharacterized protein (TIGR02266 family)